MGLVLKQVLRTLCGVNQWSYAVFWKIGTQNPKLLIWEDCYYKSMPFSAHPSAIEGGLEAYLGSDMHSSGIQVGDRVHLLVNKMMMNNQVNIVGEGLIGRAAFTGKHEWILASNYIGHAHPLEVLNELSHQFSAGMQTVAVIPVFPHGVVQFGSTFAIMENLGFVNIVKSLILQLGCVPGVLLSDNCTENEYTEHFGVPISIGVPVGDVCGSYKAQNTTPLLSESSNQQCISSMASRFVGQPSCSQTRQIEDSRQSTGVSFLTPNLTNTSAKSYDLHKPKVSPWVKPSNPFGSQQENGVVGAEVIPQNSDTSLKYKASSGNSRPVSSHQLVDHPDANKSNQTLLEQQIFSGYCAQNLIRNKIAPERFMVPQMVTSGGPVLSSGEGFHTFGRELDNGVGNQMRPTSVPCALSNQPKLMNANHSSVHPTGVVLHNKEDVPLAGLVNQLSTASGTLSGCSDHIYHSMDVKHDISESTSRKEVDYDLFQALNIPCTQSDESFDVSVDERLRGSSHDYLKNASGSQGKTTANAKHESQCAPPSYGDDLYDVLGVDFKNKLLNGQHQHNNFSGGNSCSKAEDMGSNASTLNIQGETSDFYAVNQMMSENSIFSVTETDHLLDAVVSSAQTSAKQSSDDVSCSTALTKISSSVLSDSHMYGRANISDQAPRDLFNLCKGQEKAGMIPSSSFQSGCSKDDTGSCSQSTSFFRSQLSSWVEEGHNVRHDSSVSTAFSKKNDEASKPTRKRVKPGENPRPRPKDRQMIQDRVKELREIVPNGAKCSIDALFERTIKHMLFLQSVTKHADKLKQAGESKIINKEGGLLLKENSEGGGATWAFEVGSQSMRCPIIVEDLNPPRQLLVEMLCENRGFFLEIADLIRGLGLTILKGVMEARNDKIWARFAVEANRDVTRMEIFMSLVQLLEQTVKGGGGGASPSHAMENSDMMVHRTLPQSTSIPATGRLSSLQ